MSLLTSFLKLFKWDTSNANDLEEEFDIDKAMNDNWDKLDEAIKGLDTNKVDKVDGKGLSTNDFTNEDKAKLDGLNNYDDTEITQEIEDIQEEQAKQNEDIEDLKQINAKQDDLIQKLKDNCINVTTEEATSLHVTDASTLPAKLDIRGNQRQATREGYSLWDYLNVLKASAGGLTIEKDYENGYITVNGMPSKDYVSIVSTAYITNLLEDGQRYTLWQENYQNEETAGIYLQVTRTDDNGTTRYYSLSNSATFLVDKSNNASYSITLQTSSVDGTGTLTNYRNRYMLYKGTDEKSYELPGASPSLDYPSEVRTVGDNVNVLPNNAVSKSVGGVNWTVNADGSVDAVGTATTNSTIDLIVSEDVSSEIFKFKKGIKYKNVGNVDICYRKTDADYGRFLKGTILELEEDMSVSRLYLQVNSGVTVDETYYPKLVEYYEGMDESYSPYGQGSVEIKKINSNIMPILNLGKDWEYTENGIKNLVQNGKRIFTINLKKGQTVRLCFKALLNPSVSTTFTMYLNGNVRDDLSFLDFYKYELNKIYTKTYTATEDCELYSILWGNANNETFEFQLWANLENAEDYQQYEEQSYILDIQKPMLLGDYFDLERGKEVHKWIERELTGTENITLTDTVNGIAQFTFSQFYDGDYDPGSVNINALSNCYKGVPRQSSWLKDNSIALVGGYTARIMTSEYSTVEEFKQMLAEKYAEGNPVKIYYKLIKPKELGLTEEQKSVLQQLSELPLFKGTNNIITAESLALMQLSYIADTQSYIDSQIDEKLANINAQILELAGGN